MASVIFLVTRSLASGSRLWVPTLLLMRHLESAEPGSSRWRRGSNSGSRAVRWSLITILTAALYRDRRDQGGDLDGRAADLRCCSVRSDSPLWYLLGHIPGGWDGRESSTSPGRARL